MKWLHATSRNIVHGLGKDNEIDTVIEAVLTTSENLLMRTEIEQSRFFLTIESAENLITTIDEWVNDAKKENAIMKGIKR